VSGTLVVQTAWIGDTVLTIPLLTTLAERHGPVDVLTTPAAAPLLEVHPAVAHVLRFDKRGRDRGASGLWRVARAVRRRGYATAILAQGSVRSALVPFLAGIPTRVGFDDAPGRWFCTERVSGRWTHEADRLTALAAPAAAAAGMSLMLTEADRQVADALLAGEGVVGPFAALAPGSARATKQWPYYPELAVALASSVGVVILDGPGGAGVRAAIGPRGTVADLTGRLTIRQAAAVLERAAVAVTNDSAALHMAQAVGTPVVGLFGPTPAARFGPRGARDRIVAVDGLACRPCSTHGDARCPLVHHRCLRDMPVDTVHRIVQSVLQRSERVCG